MREITYQEAWNKICEYMNKDEHLTFTIGPWDKHDIPRYTLKTINQDADEYIEHFVADKEWIKC